MHDFNFNFDNQYSRKYFKIEKDENEVEEISTSLIGSIIVVLLLLLLCQSAFQDSVQICVRNIELYIRGVYHTVVHLFKTVKVYMKFLHSSAHST